jgi:uncharacterized NAD(P)/FAD-binding protein YdhS
MTRTFAIVGAGFSGMAVAVHLLQRLREPARVCLINRSLSFGRGLAYGTNSPSHLLNVPAGRMSIDPTNEAGFIDYLRSRGLTYKASDFVPRSLYGDYLERCLLRAQSDAAEGVRLEMVESEVLSLETDASGGSPVLRLANGREIEATEAVLALGNFTPQPPRTARVLDWSVAPLVNDVWARGGLELLAPDSAVLLVGTGLTAYDAVLRLLDQGHRGSITMLSRRALLPQPHRELETAPAAGLVPADFLEGVTSIRQCVHGARELIARAALEGHDWRDVIGGMRAMTPRLWAQLDAKSRRQFVRHVGPFWDTHRHRAAPAIYRRIRAAIDAGQLSIVQGRLVDIEVQRDRALVSWRARGAADSSNAAYSAVVNCTGPSSDLRRVADPLISHLIATGLVKPDRLALGLAVDDDYRMHREDGKPLDQVRYVGPLLKAQRWEATAVPELRVHARRLADQLIDGA